MLKWFRRYVAWLCLTIALAGAVIAAIAWKRHAVVSDVVANGREAVAIIEQAKSFRRKDGSSFEIALSWKDKQGAVKTATKVPITGNFADRIISEGVLLVPATKIKYLPEGLDKGPVIVDDAQNQLAEMNGYFSLGLIGLVLGVIGAVAFSGFWWRNAVP